MHVAFEALFMATLMSAYWIFSWKHWHIRSLFAETVDRGNQPSKVLHNIIAVVMLLVIWANCVVAISQRHFSGDNMMQKVSQ